MRGKKRVSGLYERLEKATITADKPESNHDLKDIEFMKSGIKFRGTYGYHTGDNSVVAYFRVDPQVPQESANYLLGLLREYFGAPASIDVLRMGLNYQKFVGYDVHERNYVYGNREGSRQTTPIMQELSIRLDGSSFARRMPSQAQPRRQRTGDKKDERSSMRRYSVRRSEPVDVPSVLSTE